MSNLWKILIGIAWACFSLFMAFVRIPELMSARSDGSVLAALALCVSLLLFPAVLLYLLYKPNKE